MSFISRFFHASAGPSLVGLWQRVDDPSVALVFSNDGRLEYRTTEDGTTQISLLTYRLDRDWIISDQPSTPREERTKFRFEGQDTLVLTYDGEETKYQRSDA